MGKVTVVINTLNEAKTLERAIKSVRDFADEVLVCDMHSEDDSASIARKLGAKVITHERLSFVEPARNFAVSKAVNDWILVLDPDEEIPDSLAKRLLEMIDKPIVSTFVEIPRKNMIFGKWVKSAGWWPDYNIRFFKKGAVKWSEKIHRPPDTEGQGIQLPAEERWAITHHHYDSISQYLERLNRYTTVQANELKKENMDFRWEYLITKPLAEFLSRFFANKGYEDGLHGLALSLLQAVSELVVYCKLWEAQGFEQENLDFNDVKDVSQRGGEELTYWLKYGNLSKNPLKNFLQRVKNRL